MVYNDHLCNLNEIGVRGGRRFLTIPKRTRRILACITNEVRPTRHFGSSFTTTHLPIPVSGPNFLLFFQRQLRSSLYYSFSSCHMSDDVYASFPNACFPSRNRPGSKRTYNKLKQHCPILGRMNNAALVRLDETLVFPRAVLYRLASSVSLWPLICLFR